MKLLTLTVLGFIFIIQTSSVSGTRSRIQADRTANLSKSLIHSGLERAYHLHIPSSYRSSTAVALVVALHGGGGHTWPGGYQYLPEFLIGKTSRDLNATITIWNFFNGHPK